MSGWERICQPRESTGDTQFPSIWCPYKPAQHSGTRGLRPVSRACRVAAQPLVRAWPRSGSTRRWSLAVRSVPEACVSAPEVEPPSGLHRGWNGRPGPAAGVHFLGGAAAGLAGPEAPWTPREARGRRSRAP